MQNTYHRPRYGDTIPQDVNKNKRLYTFDDLAAAVIAENATEAAKDNNPTPENISVWASVMRAKRQILDARQRERARGQK